MRPVAIAGGLLFAVAVLGAAEASYAQQPGKAPLTLQPVPGLGVTPSPGPAAPAPILLSGTTVAPPRSPKGRPAPATPASPPSRELTGVDFTIAGDTRSRELVGVDFVVSGDVRSREIAGVDFTAAGDTRSRELVGVDFVVSSDVRSRELTGVDFVLPQ